MLESEIGLHALHADATIDYQLNRWRPGARLADLESAAARIVVPTDCTPVMLELAAQADAEQRDLHAATCYRAAEFFAPFDDPRKTRAYDAYRQRIDPLLDALGARRLAVPFAGAKLPVLHFAARGRRRDTLVIHGGFDSYMEEFAWWAEDFTPLGLDVVLFEGPGQGAALRREGLTMSPDWRAPVAAVLDALQIDSCALFGLSLGGCLALRAAADEPRVRRVVLVNVLDDFLDCFLARAPAAVARQVRDWLERGERARLEAMVAGLAGDPGVAWALGHGRVVSGTRDGADFLDWLRRMATHDVSGRVRQPCLLTAGTRDHIVPLEQFHRQAQALHGCPLSARLFSEAEHAGAHCQIDNPRLMLDVVGRWLRETMPA